MSTPLILIVLGALLLFLGRKLFWLFVGGVGFVFAMNLASRFIHSESETTILVIAVIVGIVGAIAAIFLQKIAVGVAGFLAGGYVATTLVTSIVSLPDQFWLTFAVGGILGAIMVVVLFDWALIVLSSLAGAVLITQGLHVRPLGTGILLIVLFICGVLVQARIVHGRKSKK